VTSQKCASRIRRRIHPVTPGRLSISSALKACRSVHIDKPDVVPTKRINDKAHRVLVEPHYGHVIVHVNEYYVILNAWAHSNAHSVTKLLGSSSCVGATTTTVVLKVVLEPGRDSAVSVTEVVQRSRRAACRSALVSIWQQSCILWQAEERHPCTYTYKELRVEMMNVAAPHHIGMILQLNCPKRVLEITHATDRIYRAKVPHH
jgi:hypothetical protein